MGRDVAGYVWVAYIASLTYVDYFRSAFAELSKYYSCNFWGLHTHVLAFHSGSLRQFVRLDRAKSEREPKN